MAYRTLILLPTLSLAVALTGWASAGSATQITGVLMDQMCSSKAEAHLAPGPRLEGGRVVAEAHTRQCALMPDCQKSGYGIYTDDNKFLLFDANGNKLALKALKESQKLDDLEVEVTGTVEGSKIKVSSLKLQ